MAGYNGFNPIGGYNMPNQGFPNYTTPNNGPSTYNGYQSQMTNPYTMQQPTQNVSAMNVVGRIVEDEKEILPNERPMDGSMGLFPKSDYSCIYAVGLNGDFTPRNIKFVPESGVVATDTEGTTSEVVDKSVLDHVDELINARFDDLERLIKRNNNNRNYKKPYKKPYDKNNQNGSGNDE